MLFAPFLPHEIIFKRNHGTDLVWIPVPNNGSRVHCVRQQHLQKRDSQGDLLTTDLWTHVL